MKNLAVGYFYNAPFTSAVSEYLPRIKEVFFAWPGVLSCRPAPTFTKEVRTQLIRDLKWCRNNDIKLDTLFNANCYGDDAISTNLADFVLEILGEMDHFDLLPDTVTTTSPFIATVIKKHFPDLRLRASINMRIHGSIGLEYLGSLFDEFYLSRENHRDLTYVKHISEWAKQNGKTIGMQVNSGCLRDCPFQQFHDNLHGHGDGRRPADVAAAKEYDFSFFKCKTRFDREKGFEDIIRATWIRPEDVPLFEPYVSLFKLAIRRHPHPLKVLKAYADYTYDGNLLDLLDPVHTTLFPFEINNKAFPKDFAISGIGNTCAQNCTHCGRCSQILEAVKTDPLASKNLSNQPT